MTARASFNRTLGKDLWIYPLCLCIYQQKRQINEYLTKQRLQITRYTHQGHHFSGSTMIRFKPGENITIIRGRYKGHHGTISKLTFKMAYVTLPNAETVRIMQGSMQRRPSDETEDNATTADMARLTHLLNQDHDLRDDLVFICDRLALVGFNENSDAIYRVIRDQLSESSARFKKPPTSKKGE